MGFYRFGTLEYNAAAQSLVEFPLPKMKFFSPLASTDTVLPKISNFFYEAYMYRAGLYVEEYFFYLLSSLLAGYWNTNALLAHGEYVCMCLPPPPN